MGDVLRHDDFQSAWFKWRQKSTGAGLCGGSTVTGNAMSFYWPPHNPNSVLSQQEETMKTYKIFDVYVNDGVVYIHCTDPDTIKTIIREAKQYVPSMRSNEGTYGAHLDKLQNREYQVKWWIMQQLCLKGWEPFGVTYGTFEGSYSLRLEETF